MILKLFKVEQDECDIHPLNTLLLRTTFSISCHTKCRTKLSGTSGSAVLHPSFCQRRFCCSLNLPGQEEVDVKYVHVY